MPPLKGQSLHRAEDGRLLKGAAQFVDARTRPQHAACGWARLARSPSLAALANALQL